MSTGGQERYVPAPVVGDIPPEETGYVQAFVDLAESIDDCEHDADITLLLSTCRNSWTTLNAVFVDLKSAIGAGALPDEFSRALYLLAARRDEEATDALENVGHALKEAGEKLDVWSRRAALWEELERVIAGRSGIVRSRLRDLLARQREPVPTPHVAHGRFLALDLETLPREVERLLGVCAQARERLRLVRRLAESLMPFAQVLASDVDASKSDAGPDQAQIFDERVAQDRARFEEAWPTIASQASLAKAEVPSIADALPADLSAVSPTTIDHAAARSWLTIITDACQQSVFVEHECLETEFDLNVAARPMPSPFEIDLSGADDVIYNPRSRRFKIVRARGAADMEPDDPRVGVLRCGLREDAYSHVNPRRYVFQEGGPQDVRTEVVGAARASLLKAVERDVAMVVMPEVFLPREAIDEIAAVARDSRIALVAGAEYRNDRHGQAINEAIVVVPGLIDVYKQRKQGPSVYEVRQEEFAADSALAVFRQSPVGVMGVVVCSDYLELDLVAQLADVEERLDVLVICARNPSNAVFEHLAVADAARLYASVIVVNSKPDRRGSGEAASSDGTLVAIPAHTPLLPATDLVDLDVAWSHDEVPKLEIYTLPLAETRSRDRARPTGSGFLPAPYYVRRRHGL